MEISDSDNLTVFSWHVQNMTTGNLFAVDYDSSITWSNLSPMGLNLSNEIHIEDFEELDTSLNSTLYPDSINTTYTNFSVRKAIENFTIYRSTIENVSVVNSTNNSNFITGILWDASDDTNGQYNGTEDVVFVSKIRDDLEGKYGVYDFEIRVPANLRQYIPADVYSVAFYVELR